MKKTPPPSKLSKNKKNVSVEDKNDKYSHISPQGREFIRVLAKITVEIIRKEIKEKNNKIL